MSFLNRFFGGTPKPRGPTRDEAWTAAYRWLQIDLKRRGYWPHDIDGVWSDRLSTATRSFKAAKGLRSHRMDVGPLTLTKLAAEEVKRTAAPYRESEPPLLMEARNYLGEREIRGARDNPTIVAFWKEVGATLFDDDETPWLGRARIAH